MQRVSPRASGPERFTMPHTRQRRSRRKLVFGLAALAVVLGVAAVAQRRYTARDPFPAETEQTRARSEASRPVFGERPAPVEPTPAPAARDAAREIRPFLEEWRTTLMKGDIDAHTALYAPKLDRFFRQRGVTRAAVRREKERMLREYPRFRKYDVRDLKVESQTGDRAVVTFTKDWDARGRRRFAGSERQRLTLKRAGDEWQIASEEELKVFYVRRG